MFSLKRSLAPLLTDDKVALRLSLFRLIIFEGARFPEVLSPIAASSWNRS